MALLVQTDRSAPAYSAAKKAQKKTAPQAKEQTIKLAIRLNEGINEALRTLIRYRGDLSTMALEALESVDLTRADLVSSEERPCDPARGCRSLPNSGHRHLSNHLVF
jgi:hypothetical protein